MTEYKILSMKSNDIYERMFFDGNGNKVKDKNSLKIDLDKDKNLFSSTMDDSLEFRYLNELINIKLKDNKSLEKKDFYYEDLLLPIINVSFSKDLWPYKIIYPKEKDNKEYIYVKTGFNNDNLVKKELKDKSLYIIGEEVIAVKTNSIVEKNQLIEDKYQDYFIYNEEKHVYEYTFTSKGKVSKKSLRKTLYDEGFSVIFGEKTINYKRYKRSSSKARGNKCLFIDERLFKEMNEWSYFRLPVDDPEVKKKLVEIEAYKSLTLSSIEGTIEINPKSILILPDFKYKFKSNCINIKLEETKDNEDKTMNCLVAKDEECEIENNLFDGEGLLDKSIFNTSDKYKNNSMLLLRNNYFKSCVFNTDLEQWFKDNGIYDEKKDKLNPLAITMAKNVKDIKLVITYSSLKFMKFADKGQERLLCFIWLSNISKVFGIVKTEHPGKRFSGEMVETSYQFLNTLQLDEKEANNLTKDSFNYIKMMRPYKDKENLIESSVLKFYLSGEKVKDNTEVLDEEIDENDESEQDDEEDVNKDKIDQKNMLLNENAAEKIYTKLRTELCYELLKINDKFSKTRLYGNYRNTLTNSLKNNAQINGKILVKGTNATLFGNGYEFLQYLIDKFDGKTTLIKPGEVVSKMFKAEEKLCGVRHPHITMGNLYRVTNKIYNEYNKYFKLNNEILCVNAIDENIQFRLNGCDYDSDFVTITNNEIIYNAIDKNYDLFKVPVNGVPETKQEGKKLYIVDNKIGNNQVGSITNLSQHLNSIFWDLTSKNVGMDIRMDLYKDICILAILCGMEIDKAKRNYDVNVNYEINKIRKKWLNDEYKSYPSFLANISKDKKGKTYNDTFKYNTTMTFINDAVFLFGTSKNYIDIDNIMNLEYVNNSKDCTEKAIKLKNIIKTHLDIIEDKRVNLPLTDDIEENIKLKKDFNDFVKEEWFKCYQEAYAPGEKLLTKSSIIRKFVELIKNETDKTIDNYLWTLIYILYFAKKNPTNKYNVLFDEILKTKNKPKQLVLDENGDIKIYNYMFKCE